MGIPLAWLQLSRERMRLLVALAGITFADVLMFVQLGFRDALFESAILVHRNLRADLVLINPQSQAFFAMQQFPRRRLYQALSLPEVASISPMYVDLLPWKSPVCPPTPTATSCTRSILVMGFNPAFSVLDFPEVEANLGQIRQADVVLFDRISREEFGTEFINKEFAAGRPVQTEINRRRVQVGGLFELGASFSADGNVITSDLNFLRMFPGRQAAQIDVGLITLQPGTDVEPVRAKLRQLLNTELKIPGQFLCQGASGSPEFANDVCILTHGEFVELERHYWATGTAIGFIFGLGTVMGFVVGIVVVYQILYTDVSDHLAEYATLKAMGYTDGYLLVVVFQEAMILAVLGFIPGFFVSNGLYALTQAATQLPIAMTVGRAVTVFSMTVIMCFLAGAVSVRRLGAADPADIF
ncbi:DevC protein [Gloeomargarita lithophora Alchichica-D10]|uniref:DevC protein n=1 Tax=Gloeomargarita lithophora Alchichica-D10 TaxID=1188229 RepID=A0A1J0AB86_9CYAN|nr:FtsX-like permease family protein [Gloeomargarita lithophora]APB33194.1 DevC protein [Gloeomargarita lithophora Alchichica-D10]